MKKPFDEALQDLIDAYVEQGTGRAEIGQIINRFAMSATALAHMLDYAARGFSNQHLLMSSKH